MLYFAPLVGGVSELRKTIRKVKSILSRHFVEIQQSPWRSLPELTNKNGKVCNDSSPAQAWSMATILEVMKKIIITIFQFKVLTWSFCHFSGFA
jgi:glycogen debranching enzyme